MYNKNSEYISKKMSVNAQKAYDFGEKPKSKWNKNEILEGLKSQDLDLALIKQFKNIKVSILKDNLLCLSSYHHTGSFYNKTNFYMVKEFFCNEELKEALQDCLKEQETAKQNKQDFVVEYCFIRYNVWGYNRYGRKTVVDTEAMQGVRINYSDWVVNSKQRKNIWGNNIIEKITSYDYYEFKKMLAKKGINANKKVYFNKLVKSLGKK